MASIFAPRIGLKPLADLCSRLAMATDAGLDDRGIWKREAKHASPRLSRAMSTVHDALAKGSSWADALALTGDLFPQSFHDMVAIGEKTGSLPEVFRRLSDHYEHGVSMRRVFLGGLVWPLLQLIAAVGVVGILILVMGAVGSDILGFGLTGARGVTIYFTAVGLVTAVAGLLIFAVARGALWTRPIQLLLIQLPVIGRCWRTIALARMTWVLELTMNVAMDVRQALRVAFHATGNEYYRRHTEKVVADIVAGDHIFEALGATGAFPDEFLAIVENGERSGKLAEEMGRASKQYEDQAKIAFSALTVAAGFAVWGGVAALIIFLIFRIAMFVFGVYDDALNMKI